MQEESQNSSRRGIGNAALIALLLCIIAALCVYIAIGRNRDATRSAQQALDPNQSEYVAPETPVDRSQNVTLPGWGGFTIPAGTTTITKGFEFHNPAENLWYEVCVGYGGATLENLVSDSGSQTELNHYLRLAGIDANAAEASTDDAEHLKIARNADGNLALEAVGGFEGMRTITVKTDAGDTVELQAECHTEQYYISFALVLAENDEVLYQSDLVAPGKYIQQMELTRSLEPGVYDAYVVCQPYRSDRTTKTNTGIVEITLTAG